MSVYERGKGNFCVRYRDEKGMTCTKSFGKDREAAEALDKQLMADKALNTKPKQTT